MRSTPLFSSWSLCRSNNPTWSIHGYGAQPWSVLRQGTCVRLNVAQFAAQIVTPLCRLVTIMATVSYQSAYATDIIAVQRVFYNQQYNFSCMCMQTSRFTPYTNSYNLDL